MLRQLMMKMEKTRVERPEGLNELLMVSLLLSVLFILKQSPQFHYRTEMQWLCAGHGGV